mmetsp:Transcript_53283/g.127104  ORF Transcript_53283/g.127104 Transcript_53283/m.127104 type:complete len:229 (+) Transcript_53283:1139-1825(+)
MVAEPTRLPEGVRLVTCQILLLCEVAHDAFSIVAPCRDENDHKVRKHLPQHGQTEAPMLQGMRGQVGDEHRRFSQSFVHGGLTPDVAVVPMLNRLAAVQCLVQWWGILLPWIWSLRSFDLRDGRTHVHQQSAQSRGRDEILVADLQHRYPRKWTLFCQGRMHLRRRCLVAGLPPAVQKLACNARVRRRRNMGSAFHLKWQNGRSLHRFRRCKDATVLCWWTHKVGEHP